MKMPVRIAIKCGVVVTVAAILAVIIIRSLLLIWQMPNDTMQPLISSNDVIVATKWFRFGALQSGDLVVVYVPTPFGKVPTIRQIRQQPDTPVGEFYVVAMNTNGVDSRQCGPLPVETIKAKVIRIVKCARRL